MTPSSTARCILCRARQLVPTRRTLTYPCGVERRFPLACGSCGLLLEAGHDPSAIRAMEDALRTDDVEHLKALPLGLDIYTLRIAASAFRCRAVPDGAEQVEALAKPHSPVAAIARIVALEPEKGPGVSLGFICREDGIENILHRLAAHAAWASEAVILVDGPQDGERTLPVEGFAPGAVRLAHRPLRGDFAAQRNALQALCANQWVLQLDADETLSAADAAFLPALVRMADEDGAVSIGLPRRNLVEGVLSDLYPDVQYRLNRRQILYEGRVHERPSRPWQKSFITLHGAINHHLARPHVLKRSTRYEAIAPGGGRPEERDALLSPYRA